MDMRFKFIGPVAGLLCFSAAGAAEAAPPEWQISEASGAVTVSRAGLVKTALRGGALRPGDVIKTGKKSRAVLIRGGEYLVVSPASEIQIATPEASSGGLMQIIENVGSVLFRIEKKTTPHFGVKTPYMAAVVKGTIFTVTVDREGTALKVTEGAVEVATLDDGAREMIRPGMVGRIFANDAAALRVFDGQERVIRSPKSGDVSNPAQVVASTTRADAPSPDGEIAAIEEPIGENPVNLAMVTDGIVIGDSSYAAAVAVQASTDRAPILQEQPPVLPPASTSPVTPTDSVDLPPASTNPVTPTAGVDLPPPADDSEPAVTPPTLPSDPKPTPGDPGVPPKTTPPTPASPPDKAPPPPPAAGDDKGNHGNGNGNGQGNGNGNGNGNGQGQGNGNAGNGNSQGSNPPGFNLALIDGNLVVTVGGQSYVFGKGKGGKPGGK